MERFDESSLLNSNAELEAALAELRFECDKYQILNKNLEIQLDEVKKELSHNIELLNKLHDENDALKKENERLKKSAKSSQNITNIMNNVHEYASVLLEATRAGAEESKITVNDEYVDAINNLFTELGDDLNKLIDKNNRGN